MGRMKRNWCWRVTYRFCSSRSCTLFCSSRFWAVYFKTLGEEQMWGYGLYLPFNLPLPATSVSPTPESLCHLYLFSKLPTYTFFFLRLSWADFLFRIFLRTRFRTCSSIWENTGKRGIIRRMLDQRVGRQLNSVFPMQDSLLQLPWPIGTWLLAECLRDSGVNALTSQTIFNNFINLKSSFSWANTCLYNFYPLDLPNT